MGKVLRTVVDECGDDTHAFYEGVYPGEGYPFKQGGVIFRCDRQALHDWPD
jgi:hypothetical protein